MNYRIRTILGVALSLGVMGCRKSEPIVLTQADNHGEVRVTQGAIVEVVLPGNPTTGYEWTVAHTEASLLPLVDSSFEPSAARLGAGGQYRFHFKAVAAGEVNLELIHKRAWEAEAAESFCVTVRIL